MEKDSSRTPTPALPKYISFCGDGVPILSSSDDDSNPFTPLAPTPPSAPRQPIEPSSPAVPGSTDGCLLPRPSSLLHGRSRLSGPPPGFNHPNASSSTPLVPPTTTPTIRQFIRQSSSGSPSTAGLLGSASLAASSSSVGERSALECLNTLLNDFGTAGGDPGASTSLVPLTLKGTSCRLEASSSGHGRGGFNNGFAFHATDPISCGNYSLEIMRRATIEAQRAIIRQMGSAENSTTEARDAVSKERIRAAVLGGGMSLALATSEEDSKHLCSLLDEGDEDFRRSIFAGILPSLVLIMEDTSGSRLFDKLLHVCGYDEHRLIVFTLALNPMRLHYLARKSCGVASIKKLIEAVKKQNGLIHHLTAALSFRILDLMIHATASSLVDYCLNRLTYAQNMFLFEAAVRYCSELATSENKGCFSLELCINFSKGLQREEILKEVVKHTTRFSQDTCGNYVIQCVVALEDPNATRMICEQVAKNLETLSMHRFASYVVQKCLQSSTGIILFRNLVELEDEELNMIIRDAYGNYVIQTALERCTLQHQHQHLYDRLASRIRHLPKTLLLDRHARNVIKHLSKLNNRRQA